MTLREVQAMLLLYRAAPEDAQRRALQLVPELSELVEALPGARVRRYELTLYDVQKPVTRRYVVCHERDLEVHKRCLVGDHPLVVEPVVTADEVW